jgi:hypothetical protein
MVGSVKLKQRFCNDNNLSIQLFEEPYFSERLDLYGQKQVYDDFISMIEREYNGNEEEFFQAYNELKDKIINYIKDSGAYRLLNLSDMNDYKLKKEFRQSDVYKIPNIGKKFISIDMSKANFTALVKYGMDNWVNFFSSYDWNEFMKKFTTNEHFINSKYIRQVVFGNCNPKRQVHYESYLMGKVVDALLSAEIIDTKDIYSLCSDEIIISTENIPAEKLVGKLLEIEEAVETFDFPLKIEAYSLGAVAEAGKKIDNKTVYAFIKKHYVGEKLDKLEIKCASPYHMHFVQRVINGEEITDRDLIFSFEGKMAKLLEKPELQLVEEV